MPIPSGDSAHLYATVEDFREQLGDTQSRASTSRLERLLTVASRDVDRYTGRRFYLDATPTTRYYDISSVASDEGWLLIDDIGSTAGLLVGAGLDGVDYDVLTDDEYELRPINSDLTSPDAYAWWQIGESAAVWSGEFGSWSWNRQVSITALWGWSGVPAVVEEATLIRAVNLYKRKDAPFGVAGFDGFGSVRVRADPDFVALLSPYKRTVAIA